MINTLFIFFAGIALFLGLIELWLSISRRKFSTDFLFGLFALAAGFYYLNIGLQIVDYKVTLLCAVIMFAVFPWYYAAELGYVKRNFLWSITGLAFVYYGVFFFNLPQKYGHVDYVFSYAVYILTMVYCFAGLANLKHQGRFIFYPFLIVTLYYTIFVMEEMAFNYYGLQLPWRRSFSFYYLDLFPMIIVLNKLVLLIRDQLNKGSLEKSLNYYRENLNTILDKANQLAVAMDLEGKIIYGNSAFKGVLNSGKSLSSLPFVNLLDDDQRELFRKEVLEKDALKGIISTTHHKPSGKIIINWSFIKPDITGTPDTPALIYLFGSDITHLKKTEQDLRMAYGKLEELKNKLQAENIQLRTKTVVDSDNGKLIGKSPLFHYVLNRIEDAAPLDIPILLEGETGVGKELFANAIHEKSTRRNKAFIKVNCAAIPGELLESELFGYEKGAFTGAEKNKKGVFELADGGTLFLDEIGELPISLQPKLLRAIQEQRIKPLGSEKERQINIRLVAATNRSLLVEVENGNFRSDLYYRLNVFPITVPPLRNRKEDIPLLVDWFVNHFNEKYSKGITEVSESLMEILQEYSWPGNIRQLRNVIERAVITSSESVLKLAAPLPKPNYMPSAGNEDSVSNLILDPTEMTLEAFERQFITQTLRRFNWKISGKASASEALDLPPSTLRSKMKKLGIQQESPS